MQFITILLKNKLVLFIFMVFVLMTNFPMDSYFYIKFLFILLIGILFKFVECSGIDSSELPDINSIQSSNTLNTNLNSSLTENGHLIKKRF